MAEPKIDVLIDEVRGDARVMRQEFHRDSGDVTTQWSFTGPLGAISVTADLVRGNPHHQPFWGAIVRHRYVSDPEAPVADRENPTIIDVMIVMMGAEESEDDCNILPTGRCFNTVLTYLGANYLIDMYAASGDEGVFAGLAERYRWWLEDKEPADA